MTYASLLLQEAKRKRPSGMLLLSRARSHQSILPQEEKRKQTRRNVTIVIELTMCRLITTRRSVRKGKQCCRGERQ
jgi:hypothetical protein